MGKLEVVLDFEIVTELVGAKGVEVVEIALLFHAQLVNGFFLIACRALLSCGAPIVAIMC